MENLRKIYHEPGSLRPQNVSHDHSQIEKFLLSIPDHAKDLTSHKTVHVQRNLTFNNIKLIGNIEIQC